MGIVAVQCKVLEANEKMWVRGIALVLEPVNKNSEVVAVFPADATMAADVANDYQDLVLCPEAGVLGLTIST